MIKCVLPVLEMSCAVCANNVETTVKKLPGVLSATVNFASENLVLTYDPSAITLEEIAAAVEAAGYGLVISEEEKEKQREAAADPALQVASQPGRSGMDFCLTAHGYINGLHAHPTYRMAPAAAHPAHSTLLGTRFLYPRLETTATTLGKYGYTRSPKHRSRLSV